MFMEELELIAEQFAQDHALNHNVFATAESCTGGLISAAITSISGSSAWFDRGFVTYTNEAKQELLQVPAHILEQYGAVSNQTASYMVSGALNNSHADFAVAVTGIAGPTGGSKEKPVGTVCIAFKHRSWNYALVKCHYFAGNRGEVRAQTAKCALQGLLLLSAQQELKDYDSFVLNDC